MSATAVSPNNAKLAFRDKPQRERSGTLPAGIKRKVSKLKRRGLISEKAAKRIG